MLIHVIRRLAEQEKDPLDRSVLLDLAAAMEKTPDDPFVELGVAVLIKLGLFEIEVPAEESELASW